MAYNNASVSDANCPGTTSQGVGAWIPSGPALEIEAVTDYAYTVPGHPVQIFALANDIGTGLVISSVSVVVPTNGVATTGGTTVYFNPSNTEFVGLLAGEFTDVTLAYTIQDGVGNSDDGFIVVRIQRQFDAWVDQDGNAIIDQDEAFVAVYPELAPIVWIDQDFQLVLDQDAAAIDLEGTA